MAPKKLMVRLVGGPGSHSYRWAVSRSSDELDLYVMRTRRIWRPPTDVYETDRYVVVKVEIAGLNEDDFDISLVDRRLVIAGHRKDPAGKLVYHNMEISHGEFRTEVYTDWAVDEAACEATYEEGFLLVRLPKVKEHRVQLKVIHHVDDKP